MGDVIKELFEDYQDLPFWVYLVPVIGAVIFFPFITLLLIVLGG